MKKKIIISLLLIIPFISILLVVIFRGVFSKSNEEIIKDLKDIGYYEAKVEYIIKNSKNEERENTIQYYSKDDGVRVEFEEDRIKIYKNDGIYVKDNISDKEYLLEDKMDILHSLAFINKILSYPIKSGSIVEGQEEWGDTIYIQADFELFLDNDNLNTARVFIDKKNKSPIGIIIYNKKNEDKVRIIYKDFKIIKDIEDELFEDKVNE